MDENSPQQQERLNLLELYRYRQGKIENNFLCKVNLLDFLSKSSIGSLAKARLIQGGLNEIFWQIQPISLNQQYNNSDPLFCKSTSTYADHIEGYIMTALTCLCPGSGTDELLSRQEYGEFKLSASEQHELDLQMEEARNRFKAMNDVADLLMSENFQINESGIRVSPEELLRHFM